MRLRRASKVNLFIAVDFINESEAPGLKKGGVLTVVRPEIELIVTASEIPESITVDLTGLEVGDVITISSVNIPDGAKPTIDRDFVIANVSAPSSLKSSEEAEEDNDAPEEETVETSDEETTEE
jgi:large subunit ribosomal protein L25